MIDDTAPSNQAPKSDPKQVQRAKSPKKPRAKPPVKSEPTQSSIYADSDGDGNGSDRDGDAIGTVDTTEATTHNSGNVVRCGEGDVALTGAEPAALSADTSDVKLIARTREGEGRAACWERLRKEARAVGMLRGQGPGTAYEWATRETERLFPPKLPEPEPVIVEPEPVVELEPEPIAEPVAPTIVDILPQPPAEQGVPGLGDIPGEWGTLAANASLQVEISWVSANRLRVRDGNGVNLSRALSPAPSYSALSWLETSILFPAKFADISVKATANQEDEAEAIRREKLSIEEVRSILAEMLKG